MKSPYSMVKTGVNSAGIHIIAKAKLLYAAQTLKIRMLNNIEHQRMRYGDKTMNRVIKNLALIHTGGRIYVS